jgi:2'-5' RNA ligase
MATSFYVGFRLHGYAKEYAKWTIARAHREAKIIRIKGKRLPPPHITLFGPAKTNNLKQTILEVERIGRKYTLIPFKIDGFSRFEKEAKVIYLGVVPSPDLEQFEQELASCLIWQSTEYTEWDTMHRRFHVTVFHSKKKGKFTTRDDSKFNRLCDYVENHCTLENFRQHEASILGKLVNIIKKYILRVKEEEGISQHLLRVTILGKGSRIQCEYDLVLRRLLSRREALSRYWWRKTVEKLRTLQGQSERGGQG